MATEFKVGQIVQIIGDYSDCTDHLDGEIGVIKEVDELDCTVAIVNDGDEWFIWKRNLIPMSRAIV